MVYVQLKVGIGLEGTVDASEGLDTWLGPQAPAGTPQIASWPVPQERVTGIVKLFGGLVHEDLVEQGGQINLYGTLPSSLAAVEQDLAAFLTLT